MGIKELTEQDLNIHKNMIIDEILSYVCQCDDEKIKRVDMLLNMLIMTQDKIHENRSLIER